MNDRQFELDFTDLKDRKFVRLTEDPKMFGRIDIYVDICLRHEKIAKRLFEIRWNSQHLTARN